MLRVYVNGLGKYVIFYCDKVEFIKESNEFYYLTFYRGDEVTYCLNRDDEDYNTLFKYFKRCLDLFKREFNDKLIEIKIK